MKIGGVKVGEIKFRAWDKKKNKMIYIHSNDSILLKNNQAIVYREDQFDDDEECFCCESINDVELLQYTGLKDKNDKEIYEGDIVIANLKYFDIKNEKCKVISKTVLSVFNMVIVMIILKVFRLGMILK